MTLEDAILFAVNAHKGQMDKAGKPYMLHPLRVMLNPILEPEEERVPAVLHDIVEDCNVYFLHRSFWSWLVTGGDCLSFIRTTTRCEKHDCWTSLY